MAERKTPVNVRIDGGLYEAASRYADQHRLSKAEAVNRLLEIGIKQEGITMPGKIQYWATLRLPYDVKVSTDWPPGARTTMRCEINDKTEAEIAGLEPGSVCLVKPDYQDHLADFSAYRVRFVEWIDEPYEVSEPIIYDEDAASDLKARGAGYSEGFGGLVTGEETVTYRTAHVEILDRLIVNPYAKP